MLDYSHGKVPDQEGRDKQAGKLPMKVRKEENIWAIMDGTDQSSRGYKMQRDKGRNKEAQRGKKYWLNERTIVVFFGFRSMHIERICYDLQCEVLGIRLRKDMGIIHYFDVPEEIWYRFRESASPDLYYHCCIHGHYPEQSEG